MEFSLCRLETLWKCISSELPFNCYRNNFICNVFLNNIPRISATFVCLLHTPLKLFCFQGELILTIFGYEFYDPGVSLCARLLLPGACAASPALFSVKFVASRWTWWWMRMRGASQLSARLSSTSQDKFVLFCRPSYLSISLSCNPKCIGQ